MTTGFAGHYGICTKVRANLARSFLSVRLDSYGRDRCRARSAARRGVGGHSPHQRYRQGKGILVMNAKSLKRALGLAAAAAGTSGTMMLAPAVANAATAHPAHAQTATSVSKANHAGWGWGWGWGGWGWGGWGCGWW